VLSSFRCVFQECPYLVGAAPASGDFIRDLRDPDNLSMQVDDGATAHATIEWTIQADITVIERSHGSAEDRETDDEALAHSVIDPEEARIASCHDRLSLLRL
jgi:hypothetical protein